MGLFGGCGYNNNNGNSCLWIIIILVLLFCCGCNNGSVCGTSTGCGNGCCD